MSCLVPRIPLDISFNMLISGNLGVQGNIIHENGSNDFVTNSHSTDYYNFSNNKANKGFKFTNSSNQPHLTIKPNSTEGFVGVNTINSSYNLDVSGTTQLRDLSATNIVVRDLSVNDVISTRYLVVNGVSFFDVSGQVPEDLYVVHVNATNGSFTNLVDASDISCNRIVSRRVDCSNGFFNNLYVSGDISAVDISFNTIQGQLGRISHIDCSDISLNRIQNMYFDLSSGFYLNGNARIRHIDCSDISLNRIQTTNVEINNGIIANSNIRAIHIDCSDISLNRIQTTYFDLSSGFYLNGNARIRHIDCSDISLNRIQTTNVEINNGIITNSNIRAIHIDCSDISLNRIQTTNVEINNGIIANANARIIHIDCSDISLNRLQNTYFDLSSGFYLNGNARIRHIDCSDISLNTIQSTRILNNSSTDISSNIRLVDTLFSDSSNKRIGIGLTPSYNLDVSGTTNLRGDLTLTSINGVPYLNATAATGNMLIVDTIYGNDTIAALYPTQIPFKTITAAVAASLSGYSIIVRPGVYAESNLIMKQNTTILGSGTQTTIIRRSDISTNTKMVDLSTNCRIEALTITAILASNTASNIEVIGVYIGQNVTGCKIRPSVINIDASAVTNFSPNIYGVLCENETNADLPSLTTMRSCTINCTGSGSGNTIGFFARKNNSRLTCRDSNIYVKDCSNNNKGGKYYAVGTLDASTSLIEVKTSSISGIVSDPSNNGADISQFASNQILVANTDIINVNANSKSFTINNGGWNLFFCVANSIAINNRNERYILPGTVNANDLTTNNIGYYFSQKTIVTGMQIDLGQFTDPSTNSITITVYKNNVAITDFTVVVSGGVTELTTQNKSVSFLVSDKISVGIKVNQNNLTVGSPFIINLKLY